VLPSVSRGAAWSSLPIIIEIHIHASGDRHNYLDPDPTYTDAYGLPLPRMTFDWNDNELRIMEFFDERCTEIGRALNGSGLGGRGKGTHFGVTGYPRRTTSAAP